MSYNIHVSNMGYWLESYTGIAEVRVGIYPDKPEF